MKIAKILSCIMAWLSFICLYLNFAILGGISWLNTLCCIIFGASIGILGGNIIQDEYNKKLLERYRGRQLTEEEFYHKAQEIANELTLDNNEINITPKARKYYEQYKKVSSQSDENTNSTL